MRGQHLTTHLFAATLPVLACSRPLSFHDVVVEESRLDSGTADWGDQGPIIINDSVSLQFDLLFVIDNSASMAAKQEQVLQSLSKIMRGLENLQGGPLDVHIGVISTDVGEALGPTDAGYGSRLGDQGLLWGNDPTSGALATVAGAPGHGCGLVKGARWIEHQTCFDGSQRSRNYQGEMGDVLGCMARAMGNGGSEESHDLLAIPLALRGPDEGINQANTGFRRWRAPLLIIVVSDKDDCTAVDDSDGPCVDRWREAIEFTAYAPFRGVPGRCVDNRLADVDTETPGLQPDCQVTFTFPSDHLGACADQPAHVQSVPECLDPASGLPIDPDRPHPQLDSIPAESRPCWYFTHDGLNCRMTFGYQLIEVRLKPGQFSPPGGSLTVTCRADPRRH